MPTHEQSPLSGIPSVIRAAFVASLAGTLSLLAGCGGGGGETPPPTLTETPPPALTVTANMIPSLTSGQPFTALATASGAVLVSVSASGAKGDKTGVEVFQRVGGLYVSQCVNELPEGMKTSLVMGMNLFAGGAHLGVALEDQGLALYRVADLVGCQQPIPTRVRQGAASGTLDVTFTANAAFAFVDNEYGVVAAGDPPGNVGVTAIARDSAGNFTDQTKLLGMIPLPGGTVAGVTLSPDGTRLYVTTEVAPAGTVAPGSSNPILGGADTPKPSCTQKLDQKNPTLYGLLTVIDAAKAQSAPGPGAIIKSVAAGCSPVRMAVTADGKTLWVAARGDNRVLAFNTALLESADPALALIGYGSSGGIAPVGIQLFHGDRLLAVANSNRFATPAVGNTTVLNVTTPASPIVIGTLSSGYLFPRNISLGSDGSTLYVTNFDSNLLQVFETTVK